MERSKDHETVAATLLSGSAIDVGHYDSRNSTSPSIFIQTEDNAEPIYMKVSEAKLLMAALAAVVDYLEKGE